ncbi:MFS transporter [Vibrio astriarenae]
MVNTAEPNKRWVLYILCLAQFTLSADVANLSISTATLVKAFNSDIASIQLLGSIQPLIGAALMLSSSMIGLIIGWRRLLIGGMSLGLISSLGFLVFHDIQALSLIARPLAGVSSAMILPAALALVVAHFPGKKRAIGFGMMAAATGLAAAIIPLLSGWLQDHLHWKWAFTFITCCYFFTLVSAVVLIKPIHSNRPARFDVLGALLGSLSIITLFFGLLKAPYWGLIFSQDGANLPNKLRFLMPISPALILLCIGGILLVTFVFQQQQFERKYGYALLPTKWLTTQASRTGFIVLSLMYITLGGSSFIIVTYLQVAIGLSSIHSGSIILLFSAAMILTSITTPLVFKHISLKTLCCSAFIGIGLAAAILLLSSSAQGILTSFYFGMVLLGTSIGILACQCPVLITNALSEREAEQSGGLQATVRNIGLVLGISLFGGVNQTTLDNVIRSDNEILTHYPTHFQSVVSSASHIPYVNNQTTLNISTRYHLDDAQTTYLITINAKARVKGFDVVMLTLMSVALIGLILSSNITTSRRATLSPLHRKTDTR